MEENFGKVQDQILLVINNNKLIVFQGQYYRTDQSFQDQNHRFYWSETDLVTRPALYQVAASLVV